MSGQFVHTCVRVRDTEGTLALLRQARLRAARAAELQSAYNV